MKSFVRAAVVVAVLISLAVLSGCGGGAPPIQQPPPKPPTITTVSLPDASWQSAYSQQIQATGVAPFHWTVSAGALPHGLSLSNASSNPATITGTPDTLAQGVAFTIQVTDASNQSATQPYSISVVSSISVAVSPVNRNGVAPNKTQPFIATVSQDPTHQGVNWTLTQNGTPCSPACGTIAPTCTASGLPATYTAPATVPANATVSVTATSMTDATRAFSANVVIGVPNPVPFIDQPLVPASAVPGGPAFSLTVNGTGFVTRSVVNWNGRARTTHFVSKSQLTADILITDIANPTTASITVSNPSLGGGTSNGVFFPVASTIPAVFLVPTSVVSGVAPLLALTGDFNRDGRQDLAVAYSDGTAGVLFGGGDGTFGAPSIFTAGPGVTSMAVADVNGDGTLDLVMTFAGGTVSVFLGNGIGSFGLPNQYPVGTNPVSVAVGDFNGDGILDLAVANQNCTSGAPPCGPQASVSILLGNGDGTFQPKVDYPTAPGANAVTVADFNGDGNLDLAIAAGNGGTGSQVSVLLGNGDGTFQSMVNYPAGTNPVAIATADFNKDGKLDLAVVNNTTTGSVSILMGNGDGTFQTNVPYPTGSQPTGNLATGDFNGDGNLDLAVANNGANTVSILLGKGDGTFQAAAPFATGQKPVGVAVGDFKREGRLSFAVANQSDTSVSILLEHNSLSLSTSSLSFVPQLVGNPSATQTETLTNISTAPVMINSVTLSGANPNDFSLSGTCGSSTSLAAGAKCDIDVTFNPFVVGPRNASIAVADDSAESPESVSVAGIGVFSGPNTTFSTGSLTFADQLLNTTSPPQTITLNNYGTATLSISGITASTGFAETHDCGASLAPVAGCTINVTFTPGAINTLNGMLSVSDDASANPQIISLSGAGTVVKFVPAGLSFSCSYQFFFRPGCSCTGARTTTVTNTGSTPLSISGIATTGSTIFHEISSTCPTSPTSVGPGQSCTITVGWNPFSFSTGVYTGAVSVSDDGGGSPQTVGLYGRKLCTQGVR